MARGNPGEVSVNAGASAPGDLPQSVVIARSRTRRWQFRHDNTILPAAPGPDEPVTILAVTGEEIDVARAAVYYTSDGRLPGVGSPSVAMHIAGADWDIGTGFLACWQATLPPMAAETVVRYRIAGWRAGASRQSGPEPDFWAHDGQGMWFRHSGPDGIRTFAYSVEAGSPVMPHWAETSIIYQIFVDRFHPGTPDYRFPGDPGARGIHGGTLRGILQSLPYLDDLGVNCLWLSPIFTSPSYHRYDCTDYFAVDPMAGSDADLHELVGAAHARNIRVILDFVPSHCSRQHPAFQAALRDRGAPTAGWFTFIDWPESYRSFLDAAPALPTLNTADPGARGHLIESAVHWVRDFGVDGYRMDHAIGPSMDFWVALRAALRATGKPVFTVAEATDTPDCLRRYRQRLDAILDFPLCQALRMTFALRTWDLARFDRFLTAYEFYMNEGPGRVSFLDNHDIDRFLFLAGGDMTRLKLAALCQFTLAPVPVVYYGTEIGLSHEHPISDRGAGGDAQARRDMPWTEQSWDHDLLQFYSSLTRLRRDHAVLAHGRRHTVHIDTDCCTYAYERSTADAVERDSRSLLVVFNLSSQEQLLAFPTMPAGHDCSLLLSTGKLPRLDTSKGLTLTMAPQTGTVIDSGSALEGRWSSV